MAIFAVEVSKISKIWEHPNADSLELGSVEGIDLQFVIRKELYAVGDSVVYFPIDSVLPTMLIEMLGLTGRLAGVNKDRVKTMKLRSAISQGVVCPLKDILEYIAKNHLDVVCKGSDIDYTTTLGVIKYDPPEIPCANGSLVPLCDGVTMFDIEGVERFPEQLETLMSVECLVTEKVEGTNYGVTVTPLDTIVVNQRNNSIIEAEIGEHVFWKVTRVQKIEDLIRRIKVETGAKQVTLRGELIGPGIQKNYYNLKTFKVLFYGVQIDCKYVSASEFVRLIPSDMRVPILSDKGTLRDWLNGESIVSASNGKSQLVKNKLREGVVITPIGEMSDVLLGRMILKKRSPEYLSKY